MYCGGGEKRSTSRNQLTCRKVLNIIHHIMLYRVYLAMRQIQTHNFSYDYHMITNMTAPAENQTKLMAR